MKRLPADAGLLVESAKIHEYLLNRDHPVGKDKAAYFLGKGFSEKDAGSLIEALKRHARSRPVIQESSTDFGTKLCIECDLDFPDGKERCIQTVWVRESEGQYRFITSVPCRKSRGTGK